MYTGATFYLSGQFYEGFTPVGFFNQYRGRAIGCGEGIGEVGRGLGDQ